MPYFFPPYYDIRLQFRFWKSNCITNCIKKSPISIGKNRLPHDVDWLYSDFYYFILSKPFSVHNDDDEYTWDENGYQRKCHTCCEFLSKKIKFMETLCVNELYAKEIAVIWQPLFQSICRGSVSLFDQVNGSIGIC